jgi:hypothetical protein
LTLQGTTLQGQRIEAGEGRGCYGLTGSNWVFEKG